MFLGHLIVKRVNCEQVFELINFRVDLIMIMIMMMLKMRMIMTWPSTSAPSMARAASRAGHSRDFISIMRPGLEIWAVIIKML